MADHCRRYLGPGGIVLANASHGDASLAAHDADLRLVAAGPRRPERVRASGCGVANTVPEARAVDADRVTAGPATVRRRDPSMVVIDTRS